MGRWRKEGWRDGGMGRWRDGDMDGWVDEGMGRRRDGETLRCCLVEMFRLSLVVVVGTTV